MNTNEPNHSLLYDGREQTLVKHFILEHYLERFAHIVGKTWTTITYVDCFSGPWNSQSERLEDSSFSIALEQLRKAKSDWGEHGRLLRLRCFFLESNREAYQRLDQFAQSMNDVEIETRNAELEDSIPQICDFVRRGGDSSFPFIFIDPTGWTGFATDLIAPLLQFRPGEALVNFMTGHILRFAEHAESKVLASFERLFGSVDYRSRIMGLTGQDREDELVRCYMDALRTTGVFDYVCPALVLHPEKDRTHFHLIYATRNTKGVEEFKRVEKKAMEVMEEARAGAQQRRRVNQTGQTEFLFGRETLHSNAHYESLRTRYLHAAEADLRQTLQQEGRVLFDRAWAEALHHPLVWDADIKAWIREWTKTGRIRLEGMTESDRVPKLGLNHWLVQTGPQT